MGTDVLIHMDPMLSCRDKYDEHGWQCKIPIRKCVEPIYVRLAISILGLAELLKLGMN